MANYANQLTIYLQIDKTIKKKEDNSNDNYAPLVYWKYKKAAMKKLTGNGYKLWEYLYSWAGTDKFNFSPKIITNEIGISDKGIRNARKELEDYNCLLKQIDKNNVYIFNPSGIL